MMPLNGRPVFIFAYSVARKSLVLGVSLKGSLLVCCSSGPVWSLIKKQLNFVITETLLSDSIEDLFLCLLALWGLFLFIPELIVRIFFSKSLE